jgi:hypothetical protein
LLKKCREAIKSVKDNISVFYCSLFVLIVNAFFFISFEAYAVSAQHPSIVSNISSTDAIDKTVKRMEANNIERLINETILPSLTNPASRIITASNRTTGTILDQSNLGNTSDMITNTQNQMNIQNASVPLNGNTSTSNRIPNGVGSNQELPPSNKVKTFTDNQTILLQFQDPTDTDIMNKLEEIKNIIVESTAISNLTHTTKSIEESNKRIIKELSEMKSSINRSSPASPASPPLSSAVISGTVAAIVFAVAILAFIWIYNRRGIKLKQIKLRNYQKSSSL